MYMKIKPSRTKYGTPSWRVVDTDANDRELFASSERLDCEQFIYHRLSERRYDAPKRQRGGDRHEHR